MDERGECEDSDTFRFSNNKKKHCVWVSRKPDKRCNQVDPITNKQVEYYCPTICKDECKTTTTSDPTAKPTTKVIVTESPTVPEKEEFNYECIWPKDFMKDYSAITSGNLISAAHSVYKNLAVGGTLVNPSNAHVSISGKVYYHNLINKRMNFNGGKYQIDDLLDIEIDFQQYEWLARNIKSSNINGKKVVVKETGNDGSGRGGCYNLYDFRNGGQGEDNGNTLVVFNTDDDICLTKTNDGRQFGPSVLAPFSKVTLVDAGFIDGIVIAKEFTTVSGGRTGSELQLHGDAYKGEIQCV